VYPYPIKYTEWEIGKQEHLQIVLDLYKAWDNKEDGKMAALFADTFRLRIPTERTEIVLPNARINSALSENRKMYNSTYNDIISAMSLHDRERNEDWVMITTYNKWVEKDGKRDSMLYHDEWRIRNGKIEFLWSFDKTPTKAFLKKNDPKK
jgi:ketosteroid isomerase-like protein